MQINNNGLNCVLICYEMLSLSSRLKKNGKSIVRRDNDGPSIVVVVVVVVVIVVSHFETTTS